MAELTLSPEEVARFEYEHELTEGVRRIGDALTALRIVQPDLLMCAGCWNAPATSFDIHGFTEAGQVYRVPLCEVCLRYSFMQPDDPAIPDYMRAHVREQVDRCTRRPRGGYHAHGSRTATAHHP